ncbi:MAG: diguanylate cyclase [Domibacillus tundrae]
MDLDGFKNINNTLGNNMGDELLQEVAIRLKRCTRETDNRASRLSTANVSKTIVFELFLWIASFN